MTLLPCPACGAEARMNNSLEPFVQCRNYQTCNLCGSWEDDGAKWNTLATYAMAGKLMEKFWDFAVFPPAYSDDRHGWQWKQGGEESYGHDSFESAIRDAYKTLIEEATE